MKNKLALFVLLVYLFVFCAGCAPSAESQANQIIKDFEAIKNEVNNYVATDDPRNLIASTNLEEIETLTERVDGQYKTYSAELISLMESYRALEGQIDPATLDNNMLAMQEFYKVTELLRLSQLLSGKQRAWDIKVKTALRAEDKLAYCGAFSADCDTIEAEAKALDVKEDDIDLITGTYEFLMEKIKESKEMIIYALYDLVG